MHFWDETSESLKKGQVHVNDPFCKEVSVNVPEEAMTWNVRYELLRDGPAPTPEEEEEESDEENEVEMSAETTQAPPPRRTKKHDEPEEELYQRLREADYGPGLVPLTYVPCVNGILKTGMLAVFSGQDYRVSRYSIRFCRVVQFVKKVPTLQLLLSTHATICQKSSHASTIFAYA